MNDGQKLAEARALLVDALIFLGRDSMHEPDCAAEKFAKGNRCLPANHPAWKMAPACNCIVGRIANFLKG